MINFFYASIHEVLHKKNLFLLFKWNKCIDTERYFLSYIISSFEFN